MIFDLPNLDQISNSYHLFKLHFNFQKEKPKHRQAGLTAGQAGLQAGGWPEATGLWPAQAGAQGRSGPARGRPLRALARPRTQPGPATRPTPSGHPPALGPAWPVWRPAWLQFGFSFLENKTNLNN